MSDTKSVILAAITDVAPDANLETLDPDGDLRDQLDLDSMDFLNLLVGLKERLGVEVPEVDYGEVRSLAGLVAYVGSRRGAT